MRLKLLSELQDKYRCIGAPVKATIWFTFCSFLQKGISMITTPIFTRLLTTAEYGVYSVYQSWYSILSIITTLSIASGVLNNGMIKYENYRLEYISSVQGLVTLSTLSFSVVYFLAQEMWNHILDLSSFLVMLLLVECLFQIPFQLWSARQRFEFKYERLVAVTIGMSILSPMFGILAVVISPYKAEARVLSFALVQVIVGFVFYVYNLKKGKCFFNKEYWKFTIGFAFPLIPHYLSLQLLQQSDRIIIGKIAGFDKAAIYSVAYSISSLMMLFINAINASFVPYTYQHIKCRDFGNIKNNATFVVILTGLVSLIIMALGPEIVKLFATEEYYEAIWIMPPVAASVFFRFCYSLFSNVEFYFEKKWYVMWASIGGALLNIILNYLCIPVFGYIAAGYTTLVCYILFSVFHYKVYKKTIVEALGKDCQIYDAKRLTAIAVVVLVCMIAITMLYKQPVLRYIVLMTACCMLILKRKVILLKLSEIM